MSSILISTDSGKVYSLSLIDNSLTLLKDFGLAIADLDLLVVSSSLGAQSYIGGVIDSLGHAYQFEGSDGNLEYLTSLGAGANALELGWVNDQSSAIYGFESSGTFYIQNLTSGSIQVGGFLPEGVSAAGDAEILISTLYVSGDDGNLYGYTGVGGGWSTSSSLGRTDIEGLANSGGDLYLFAADGSYYVKDGASVLLLGTLSVDGTITGAATVPEIYLSSSYAYYAGSKLGDTVFGSSVADVIVGWEGNDALYGGNGDDAFYAGTGNNVVDGGEGQDSLYLMPAVGEFFLLDAGLDSVTIGWLKGSTKIYSNTEFVVFGETVVAYADLVGSLDVGPVSYGWVRGDLTDYGWFEDYGWHYGWRYGWNQNAWAYGWNYGWHYGWYNAGAGWTVGWNVGWGVGYHVAAWSLGWGVGWSVGYFYDYGWYSNYGWHLGNYLDVAT